MRTFTSNRTASHKSAGVLDRELVLQAQNYLLNRQKHGPNDPKLVRAWSIFFPICDSALHRFAVAFRVIRSDEDDCVQAAWKDITKSIRGFRSDAQVITFYAWLRQIVYCKASDLRRERARHPTLALDESIASLLVGKETDITASAAQQDKDELISRSLRTMRRLVSETNYEVFRLRWIEGVSIERIASDMTLPNAQIRYRAARMKKKFLKIYCSFYCCGMSISD